MDNRLQIRDSCNKVVYSCKASDILLAAHAEVKDPKAVAGTNADGVSKAIQRMCSRLSGGKTGGGS